jgi:hypothetical protein
MVGIIIIIIIIIISGLTLQVIATKNVETRALEL